MAKCPEKTRDLYTSSLSDGQDDNEVKRMKEKQGDGDVENGSRDDQPGFQQFHCAKQIQPYAALGSLHSSTRIRDHEKHIPQLPSSNLRMYFSRLHTLHKRWTASVDDLH